MNDDIKIENLQATARVKGKIIDIGPVEAAGKSEKRNVIVEFQEGRFTNQVALEFFGGNVEKAADLRTGDRVTVLYSSRSRKSSDGKRWFNSNDAWQVDVTSPARRDERRDDRSPPPDDDLPI